MDSCIHAANPSKNTKLVFIPAQLKSFGFYKLHPLLIEQPGRVSLFGRRSSLDADAIEPLRITGSDRDREVQRPASPGVGLYACPGGGRERGSCLHHIIES